MQYVLEDYKNQKVNDQRNIIEKLGACVEKKYNSINYLKNTKISEINKYSINPLLFIKKNII